MRTGVGHTDSDECVRLEDGIDGWDVAVAQLVHFQQNWTGFRRKALEA